MDINYLYKGRLIDIFPVSDGDITLINIWPCSLTLNVPTEYLQELLDEFSQASIYCKLRSKEGLDKMALAKMCEQCLARTEGKACLGVEDSEQCLDTSGPVYESPEVIPGRKPEDCVPENDTKRMEEFTQAMLAKWWKGRQEHGTTVKIDPLEEAMQECLDISNYAMEQYFRVKKLKEKLSEEVQNR